MTNPDRIDAVWIACLFNAILRLAAALGLQRIGQLAAPAAVPAE